MRSHKSTKNFNIRRFAPFTFPSPESPKMATTTNVTHHPAEQFLANGLMRFTPRDSSEECSICQNSWDQDPTEGVTTPCNHQFHRDCLTTWITSGYGGRTACPMCRVPFFTELPRAYVDWEEREREREFDLDHNSEVILGGNYRPSRLDHETEMIHAPMLDAELERILSYEQDFNLDSDDRQTMSTDLPRVLSELGFDYDAWHTAANDLIRAQTEEREQVEVIRTTRPQGEAAGSESIRGQQTTTSGYTRHWLFGP
jgi:hypothetical protein